MHKQTYEVYYKQFGDYFDYIRVNVTIPEIVLGKFVISDVERINDTIYHSSSVPSKGYYLGFNTNIGMKIDRYIKSFDIIIFGFGITITRQDGY